MIDVSSGSRKRVQRHLHVSTLHRDKCLVVLCVLTDFPFGHDLRLLVQVYLVVDLLLCRSMLVTLDTVVWLSG